jgi:putative ABC transport system permease protein
MKLFQRLILRPLAGDLIRTALTILSVALGVAVVVAIELAGEAATGSFESSLTTLVGKVDYEITANGGVDETRLAALTALAIDARFAPMIEQPVRIAGHSATMYGLDSLQQNGTGAGDGNISQLATAAVVSSDLAQRFGLSIGSALHLEGNSAAGDFKVVAITAQQSTPWVAVDIAAAQRLTSSYGKLDRIDVFLGPNQPPDPALQAIRANLPSTWEIQTPGARSDENRRMVQAFRWNLRVLSYISLLVGAFLIYNTIAVSVVRRRTEIGILRAVGTNSRTVLAMFLAEAGMLGILGSLLGALLGRVLASVIIRLISDTVNSLFVTSRPGAIRLTPGAILSAMIVGTAVAVGSALIPAREAARVAPAEAMRREALQHEARLHARRDLTIAALLALASALLCRLGPFDGRPFAGYAAALLAVVAVAFISPAFVTGLIRSLRRAITTLTGAAGLIASRSLIASLARTSIIVTALATAISMMVSVGIMVGSFRQTVKVWLDNQLRADLYLRAQGHATEGQATAGIFPPVAAEVPRIIRQIPEVREVDVLRGTVFRYHGQQATLGGSSAGLASREQMLTFLDGPPGPILASLPNRDRVIVSEPFATRHNVHSGDTLQLSLGDRTVGLTVAGIYYDYSSDRGFVIADNSTLLKYLPNLPVTNIAIYLKKGSSPTLVRRAMEDKLRDFPVLIFPHELLRTQAIEVFDRTFAITWALEAVAIIVAMLGAANSLLALVLDRRREIGLVRYLGAHTAQIYRMILTEAALIGLAASVLGLILGLSLSLVLVFVINKQSFGWTIQFHPPLGLLAAAVALVWVVTVAAAMYPARYAARLIPAEAVHEE